MHKYKTVRLLFIYLTIISLVFSSLIQLSGSQIINNNKIKTDNCFEDRYIINFKDKPLLSYRNECEKKVKSIFFNMNLDSIKNYINNEITKYKEKLNSIHKTAKNEILNLLENNQKENIFKYDFISLLNAVVVKNIDDYTIEKIKKLHFVESVYKVKKLRVNIQDAVSLIKADECWELKNQTNQYIKGDGVSIAILDTGIDYTHPDLVDNYVDNGYDYINDDDDPFDDVGHGTMCAGIAAGIAPNVKIYGYKILDSKGIGGEDEAIACINDILDPNEDGDTSDCFIDIISMSFGDNSTDVSPDDILCLKIDEAVEKGIVCVAAAGNDGYSQENYRINSPGCSRKVITVGASTKNDRVAAFSSWGPVNDKGEILEKPDIVAPGHKIYTTGLNHKYYFGNGTSFSTPVAAGAIALLLQAHPDWSPDIIKNKLKEHADDLGEPYYIQGAGRINIFNSTEINKPPEQGLIIKAPSIVLEHKFFRINITKEGNPEAAFVIFLPALHKPQIRYGSNVRFLAPYIFLSATESISARIIVVKILSGESKTINIDILNT